MTREKHTLVAHAFGRPRDISSVSVTIGADGKHIWVGYEVEHAHSLLIPDHPYPPSRKDQLWRSTCFELFARRSGISQGYVEYNFAPGAAWAAYEFEDYRAGSRDADVSEPHLVDGRLEDRASEIDHYFEYSVVLSREGLLKSGALAVGLSAVIEELDGTKSYWALRHPPGDTPDFHHPDCFALDLSSPPAP